MGDQLHSKDFVRLWTQHAPRIYAFLVVMVANRADAEELLQETSMVLWEKFSEYQPGTDFRAWAYRVAFNKVRNFRQRKRHALMHMDDSLLELLGHQVVLESNLLDRQQQALADCFSKLRPTDQQLITLRYHEGATVKSVARELGRSVDVIYKALARIHSMLFDCVGRTLDEDGR